MPVVSLADRRAAGNRIDLFALCSNAISRRCRTGALRVARVPSGQVVNAAGIGSTTMAVNKAAVTTGTITDAVLKGLDSFQFV